MNIVARAEPRYYIKLCDEDAHLIHKIVAKRGTQLSDKFSNTIELVQGWTRQLEARKYYHDVCLAAGHVVVTSQTVTATHIQLERICSLLQIPALMDIHTAARIAKICELFKSVMEQASSEFRLVEVSVSEV